MRARSGMGFLIALALAVSLGAADVFAQATPPPTSNAAGQPAWGAGTTVNKDPQVAGVALDEKQVAALRSVSKFFNDLKQLKGSFAQTNPDGKRLRGKFSLKQPGKFRFDYGFGSKLLVMSDGRNLAIQDLDINTESRYQVDDTPFRILLRKDVDLMRDARVFEVQEVDDLVILTVGDKSPDVPGRIRLFLTKKPTLELKEWVTTDPQGTETRVEISEHVRTEDIDDAVYKIQAVGLPKQ